MTLLWLCLPGLSCPGWHLRRCHFRRSPWAVHIAAGTSVRLRGVRQHRGESWLPCVFPALSAFQTLPALSLRPAATRPFWVVVSRRSKERFFSFFPAAEGLQLRPRGGAGSMEVAECWFFLGRCSGGKAGCCPDCGRPRRPARWHGEACTPRRRASRSCSTHARTRWVPPLS